jgi:hypothetical protein
MEQQGLQVLLDQRVILVLKVRPVLQVQQELPGPMEKQ